ncbi:MAG TPA: WG repeat-containing protein [Halomicronema sp.]
MVIAFSDIQNHFYQKSIVQLQQQAIINGYPEGDFRPDSSITRAEFAAILLKAFPNAKQVRSAINFSDVPVNHWAYNAIKSAYEKGFISGYPDKTFQPNQKLPRVQALIIIASGLNYTAPSPSRAMLQQYFDDAGEIPEYAINGVSAAIFQNLVVNYPEVKKLRPNSSSTRAEVAGLIAQSLKIPETIPKQYIVNLDFLELPAGFSGSNFSDGLAPIFDGQKYGYMDKTGKIVIPPKFASSMDFSEGLASARTGYKSGYIDKSGSFVIPESYSYAERFSEGFAAVEINDKFQYAYISKTGQLLNAEAYHQPKPFSEGLAAVGMNGKFGYIDTLGKLIIPYQFEEAQSFSEGLALAKMGGKWGYIDKTGKFVIQPEYYEVTSFSDGLASVRLGGKFGYIDKTGKFAIPPQFDIAYPFSEGLAMVAGQQGDSQTIGQFGCIDKTGKMVIKPQFQFVESFSEGLAMVAIPNPNNLGFSYGYIDKTGKYVIYPQLGYATSFKEGLALVAVGGKWRDDERVGNGVFEGGKMVYIRNPLK